MIGAIPSVSGGVSLNGVKIDELVIVFTLRRHSPGNTRVRAKFQPKLPGGV